MGKTPKARFIRIERLRKILCKWNDCRDIITEAYQEGHKQSGYPGGLKSVMELTLLGKAGARGVLVKFGLVKRVASDSTPADIEDHLRKQEKKNLRFLKRVWGWEPGQDTITLNRSYDRIAEIGFRCGDGYIGKGERFKQFILPRGEVRAYLEENGLKYFEINGEKRSVKDVKKCSIVSIGENALKKIQ